MGIYALVKPVDSVQTVMACIVASPEVAATYLVANSGEYDYALDTSLYSPSPGIGWSYDPGLDVFSPPPQDLQAELEEAILAVDTALEAARSAYGFCDETQRSNASGNVMSNISDSPQDEQDVMAVVITWLQDNV